MCKILEELYFCNINPNEQQLIRGTEFEKAIRIFLDTEIKLTDLLDGKENKLFLDLVKLKA